MALKMILAALVVIAIGVGLALPAPGHATFGFDTAPRSQIAQIEVAR